MKYSTVTFDIRPDGTGYGVYRTVAWVNLRGIGPITTCESWHPTREEAEAGLHNAQAWEAVVDADAGR